VFLALTKPDSSIVKPAAIHITKAPITRKYNVSRAYDNSITVFSIIYLVIVLGEKRSTIVNLSQQPDYAFHNIVFKSSNF
jgi:hypothetical protein